MKIRVTESVGEVFHTIEVENPTDKVIDILLGTPMVSTGDAKSFVENLMSGVRYSEPESINFRQDYGSVLGVECNYPSYREAKAEGFEDIVYLRVANRDNVESVTLSLDQVKVLHKYFSEVIDIMES